VLDLEPNRDGHVNSPETENRVDGFINVGFRPMAKIVDLGCFLTVSCKYVWAIYMVISNWLSNQGLCYVVMKQVFANPFIMISLSGRFTAGLRFDVKTTTWTIAVKPSGWRY
jgi:hypothetical protein